MPRKRDSNTGAIVSLLFHNNGPVAGSIGAHLPHVANPVALYRAWKVEFYQGRRARVATNDLQETNTWDS